MTTTTTYESEITYKDYENAKIETLRRMNDVREDCDMDQIGNQVIFKKRVYDGALENNSDAHWYECLTRTETVETEAYTGKVIKRTIKEDLEYYGTATNGKSFWMHRTIVGVF